MMRRIGVGALAYLVPTFALGFTWHLIAFKSYHDALNIYRRDVIIPFGFLAIKLQGALFAWMFDSAFTREHVGLWRRGLSFAAFGAALSWSFSTLSVAAKNVMSSVPDYLLIETAFTIIQWALVGPLMASALAKVPSGVKGPLAEAKVTGFAASGRNACAGSDPGRNCSAAPLFTSARTGEPPRAPRFRSAAWRGGS